MLEKLWNLLSKSDLHPSEPSQQQLRTRMLHDTEEYLSKRIGNRGVASPRRRSIEDESQSA